MSSNRRFLIAFVFTCVVYALLAAYSYRDIIFYLELSRPASLSAIESGQVTSPAGRDVLMLLAGSALLYLYVQGFLLLKQNPLSRRRLIILTAILTAVAFCIVPFDSTDASVYINCGWLQTHYHLNPYACNVADVPGWFHDPMFKQHWVHAPSNYGPVFAVFCQAVTQLGGGDYVRTLFVLKAVNALCHLLIACLILFGISALQSREQATESTYLYAFSPFMLIQGVANAHNDILTSFFTCLAVVLWLYRRYIFVLLTFLVGVSIKYASIVMLPGLLYLLFKRSGPRITAESFLLGLLPVSVMSYVYLSPMDRNHMHALLTILNAGEGSVRGLIGMWQEPVLDNLLAFVIGGGCILVVVRCMYRWLRQKDESQLATQVLNDMVLFVILLSCLFNPRCQAWYPMLFFPLSMFLPPGSRVRQFSILLTGLLTFSIMWFGQPGKYYLPMFLLLAFVGSKLTAKTDSQKQD